MLLSNRGQLMISVPRSKRRGSKQTTGLTFTHPRSYIRTHASQLPLQGVTPHSPASNNYGRRLGARMLVLFLLFSLSLSLPPPPFFSLRLVNRRSYSRVFSALAIFRPYSPSPRLLFATLNSIYHRAGHPLCVSSATTGVYPLYAPNARR